MTTIELQQDLLPLVPDPVYPGFQKPTEMHAPINRRY